MCGIINPRNPGHTFTFPKASAGVLRRSAGAGVVAAVPTRQDTDRKVVAELQDAVSGQTDENGIKKLVVREYERPGDRV